MRELSTSDLWKNFRLGEEVHVAGSFIYNGLRRFHELEMLNYTDELFEFLYNLSVGIERILKIAIVLHEHTEDTDQDVLEKSLITHSHLDLLARLRKSVKINFSKPQNELLQLLSTFYKTLRYDRFSLNSIHEGKKEASVIRTLLGKHLEIEIPNSDYFGTPNEDRYRAFINRTVLKISKMIYKIINDRSGVLGLYTNELRYESKAAWVFIREVNIGDEDILWKELLIFFMNSAPTTDYLKFLKEIEPLNFDPALLDDYISCFKANPPLGSVMDEMEHHYEEMDSETRKQRFRKIGFIGVVGVDFSLPDDSDALIEDDL